MRDKTETKILAAPPVAKIVATLFACPREVADLVLTQSCFFESRECARVEPRDEIVFRNLNTAAHDLRVQRRSFFQIEHVKRKMSRLQRERLLERVLERQLVLLRKPENQIEIRADA